MEGPAALLATHYYGSRRPWRQKKEPIISPFYFLHPEFMLGPPWPLLTLVCLFVCLQNEVGEGPEGRHSASDLPGMTNILWPVYP